MIDEQLVQKMRGRVTQCRRLAAHVIDEHTRRVLLQMADEGEADLNKYLADHGEQDNRQQDG